MVVILRAQGFLLSQCTRNWVFAPHVRFIMSKESTRHDYN